jgi:hypothetical protein
LKWYVKQILIPFSFLNCLFFIMFHEIILCRISLGRLIHSELDIWSSCVFLFTDLVGFDNRCILKRDLQGIPKLKTGCILAHSTVGVLIASIAYASTSKYLTTYSGLCWLHPPQGTSVIKPVQDCVEKHTGETHRSNSEFIERDVGDGTWWNIFTIT